MGKYLQRAIFQLMILVTVLTGMACNKDSEGFQMSYFGQFTIPAGLNTFQTQPFVINDINSDTLQYFSANNSNSNKIKSINPYSIRLTSLDPGADFDFVQTVVVYIVNPNNPADYQEIFYRENIPFSNNQTLELLPSLPDIKKWIYEKNYDISVEMILRQSPPQFMDVRADIIFEAKEL